MALYLFGKYFLWIEEKYRGKKLFINQILRHYKKSLINIILV